MFNCYPFYANIGQFSCQVQNSTAIAAPTFYGPYNFQFYRVCGDVKREERVLGNDFFANSMNSVVAEDFHRGDEEKNVSTSLVEGVSQGQGNQSRTEKSSSVEAKLKKIRKSQKSKTKEGKRKLRGGKKDKAYVAKQYPKPEPSINCRYIQKNFELNIINQVFSFLWSEQKSQKYVRRFFKNEIKIALYYEYIKTVRKFCKRYINKEYLKNLCDYQSEHIAYKMVSKNGQKLEYLSMEEFSGCVRHLIFMYLRQLCPQAILTSRKMRREIWGEHLIKCRLLREYMFGDLSAGDYEKELIRKRKDSQNFS